MKKIFYTTNFILILLILIIINSGILLYLNKVIAHGIILIFLGTIILFFILNLKNYNIFFTPIFCVIKYKNISYKNLVYKFFILILLILLGQYFFYVRKEVLGYISYLFAIFQVILLFNIEYSEKEKLKIEFKEKLNNFKKLIILFILFFIFLFFFYSWQGIKNYNIFIFVNSFLIGVVIYKILLMLIWDIKIRTIKFPIIFDYIIILLFFIISIFIRIKDIRNIPDGMSLDEWLGLFTAGQILDKQWHPIFVANVQYQVSIMYYHILSFFSQFFTNNITTARTITAIVGSLNIIFIYLLGKELYSRRVGIISAILLTFSYYHIMYSRVAWLWIYVPTLATISFYFFFLGMRKGNNIFFVISGVFLGLNLYFYNSAKIVPFIYVFYWLILFIKKDTRIFIKNNFKSILLIVISSFVVFIPLFNYIIRHPDSYFLRLKTQSLIKNFADVFTPGFISFFVKHSTDTFLMFITKSSSYGYFNLPYKPLLDSISSFLFLAGSGFLFSNLKEKNNIFVFLGLLFSFSTALFSVHPSDPNPQRTILIIPFLMITIALGIEMFILIIEKLNHKILYAVLPVFLITIFSFIAYFNLYTYFYQYKNNDSVKSEFFNIPATLSNFINNQKNKKSFISPYFLNMPSFFVLNQKDNKIADFSLFEIYKYYNTEKKNVIIVVEGLYKNYIEILKEYFPSVKIKKIWNYRYLQMDLKKHYRFKDTFEPSIKFIIAEIPFKDIEKLYVLNTIFYTEKGIEKKLLKSTQINTSKNTKKIIIKNLIYIPFNDYYEFLIKGSASYKIFIDDKKFEKGKLYKGLHFIKIIISNPGNKIKLLWKRKNIQTKIGIEYFINSNKIYGLKADYFVNNKLFYSQLEPFVTHREIHNFPRIPQRGKTGVYTIVWHGYLDIKNSGTYIFILDTIHPSKIIINGKEIFNKNSDKEIKKSVFLKAGKHKIKIIYNYRGSNIIYGKYPVIRFMYKNYDKKYFNYVPYNFLTP